MQAITDSYTEEMLEVGFGKVHLMKGGKGSPLLILQDDIGSPGWLPFYAELARRFTVYVPAHPGYGKSERPAWMRSVRDLAITHNWLLTVLGLETLPVVGLGLGGWVAAELATMCHHRFSHMVLVGAVGVQPLEGEIADQFLVSGEEYVKRCFHHPVTFEALYGKETTVDQREAWEINREMTVRIAWKPYMFSHTLPILLGSVDTPTLVVWGKEDAVVPRSCAQRYVESLSRARLVVLDGCGHCAEAEKPEQLAALITDFLAGAGRPAHGR
jgi:pimeloyl-ACP methyl ester carboxylesterase